MKKFIQPKITIALSKLDVAYIIVGTSLTMTVMNVVGGVILKRFSK